MRRNAQYYKPILNQFKIGQWVWIFDPRIIPGSCDKLRSYWVGPYKIIRLMAPAPAEVIAAFEQGKPRVLSLDILKEYYRENNIHGFPSDPPHPLFQVEDEITEFPNQNIEKPITEGIRRQDRQLDRGVQGLGDRRDSVGQTDHQEISQADREVQINLSEMKRGGKLTPLWTWMEKLKCRERGRGGRDTSPTPGWKI